MIIPSGWLEYILGAAGLLVGLYLFSPSTIERALGRIRPDGIWDLRPGTRINGTSVVQYQVIGSVTKTSTAGVDMEFLRGGYLQTNGEPIVLDADEIYIPPNALKNQDTGAIECRTITSVVSALTEENRRLKYQVATKTTQANQAYMNALDFAVSISSRMGDMKKNMGQTSMFGDFPGAGFGYGTKVGQGGIPEPMD